MSVPHHTQSHLLNRILQRQISQLESQNASLKARVARLETRVSDSTAKQRALGGTAADDLARATQESETLSRETERAARLMLEQLTHPQGRLASVLHDVRHEQARLEAALAEFYSALDLMPAQARRDAAAAVRWARAKQERLLAQLAELYDEDGALRHSETETRLKVRRIEEQARAYRGELDELLEREQAEHSARLANAQEQARTLVRALAGSTERVAKLKGAVQNASVLIPTPARAAPPRPPRAETMSNPEQEEKVLEMARRALAVEAAPEPPPAPKATAAAAASGAPRPRAEPPLVPAHGDLALPRERSRPLLQIGLALAAVVVALLFLSTLV